MNGTSSNHLLSVGSSFGNVDQDSPLRRDSPSFPDCSRSNEQDLLLTASNNYGLKKIQTILPVEEIAEDKNESSRSNSFRKDESGHRKKVLKQKSNGVPNDSKSKESSEKHNQRPGGGKTRKIKMKTMSEPTKENKLFIQKAMNALKVASNNNSLFEKSSFENQRKEVSKPKPWRSDFSEKILKLANSEAKIGFHWSEESDEQLVKALKSMYSKTRKFNHLHDDTYLRISEKSSSELLLNVSSEYPLFKLRKFLSLARYYGTSACFIITSSAIFEALSITVISINSIILAFERYDAETPSYVETSDTYFLALYTIEMFMKIAALGFLMNKGSYLRDTWYQTQGFCFFSFFKIGIFWIS